MHFMYSKQIRIVLCSTVLALTAIDSPAQDRQAAEKTELAAEGTYRGKVVLPDPENILTGVKITEQKCSVHVRRHEPGSLSVESHFTQEAVIVHVDGIPGEDFYVGSFGDNQAFVLQLWPSHGVVSLTHTSFDKNGRLNYGGESRGGFTRECLIEPT